VFFISTVGLVLWIYRTPIHRGFVGRRNRCICMGGINLKVGSVALYFFCQLVSGLSL
jgi:hypothetical protein